MARFILRELNNIDIEKELNSIGFDSSYRLCASEKFEFKLIKIYSLSPAQANILKQTAISIGADCMTHRDVITGKIEQSGAIICGSVSEIKKIAEKLVFQPFGLKELAKLLLEFCEPRNFIKTKLIGILNITDNSFSDGGCFLDLEAAKRHLISLINDGADGIDIGAESTKPYSKPVSDDIQLKRIIPILEFIKKENIKLPISIDTRSSIVANELLQQGQYIINDVSGFEYDKRMCEIVAKYNARVIIQHSQGTPEVMQVDPAYKDVIEDIYINLLRKIEFAKSAGINNIIIDPGIGFGKTKENNFEILNRIEELYSLKCPVMVGISRKSLLGININNNEIKDIYTLALNSRLIEKRIDYIRVHNVKLHRDFINTIIN